MCVVVVQKSLPDYFLSLSDSIQIIQGQVGASLYIHICACVCIYLFSFRLLFFYALLLFTFCSAGHNSTQTRDLKLFFCFMIALSLCLFLQLWHLRAPLRKRWQKDEWPRYFRTQLLFLPQLASIPSCIRTEESYGDRREGTSSTISSVTNAVFTPGEEGKVIQQPPPHTHTPPPHHYSHKIFASSACKYRRTQFVWKGFFFFPLGTMQSVYGCVWKTAHFNDLPDMLSFGSAFFFWPKRLNWLCVL